MAKDDRFEKRFVERQEREKLRQTVVGPDDPPLPDAPVEPARAAHAVGRNDPCPCGSGRKYKKCCGRDA